MTRNENCNLTENKYKLPFFVGQISQQHFYIDKTATNWQPKNAFEQYASFLFRKSIKQNKGQKVAKPLKNPQNG